MRTALLFPILIALLACSTKQKNMPQADKKPNIIYIMADDLGYGDLGCYGQKLIQTPNIDLLAKEGMRFTDHYAGTSVCAPSRCVLITGKHMGNVAIRGNRQWLPHGQAPLADSIVTVAEVLKTAGYVTGMIGKWGLGISGTEGDPNKQGWDYFYGYTDQVLAHNYWPEYLVKNGEKITLTNEVKYLDTTAWHKGYGSYSTVKKEYSNDLFTKEALNFIEREKDKPFLLYLPYTVPHNNGEALPGQKMEVPDFGIYTEKDWASDSLGYAAIITRLDRYVGEIVAKVDELGLAENTLIIFTSDNGPMQERTGYTAFFDSNGQLRGGKRDLYEGGIKVPFIAKWKSKIKAGAISEHPSYFTDFLATACEIAGIETPKNTDGISYLPTLLGREQPKHAYLYFEFHEGGKSQAIRSGDWKAIRNNVFKEETVSWELYHLSQDIGEQNDLAKENPEKLKELINMASTAHNTDSSWPLFVSEKINE